MGLDRATVVRTALGVLDEVGLDGLTLRRIATELEVRAPALYWHFSNKQDLVDEMATSLLRDVLAAALARDDPAGDWLERSADICRALRRMLLSHRDGAKMFAGTHLTDPGVFDVQERSLRLAEENGVPAADAARAYFLLYAFTIGFTIEEQAVTPVPGERDERYDPDRRAERVDASKRPRAAAIGTELFADFDARFEDGLRVLIRGLTAADR